MLRFITLLASLWAAALVLVSEPLQLGPAKPPELTAPPPMPAQPAMYRPNGPDLGAVRDWNRQVPRLLWHSLPYNVDDGPIANPRRAILINAPVTAAVARAAP